MERFVEFRINKDMAEGKLSIPDMEILEICKAVSRGMYGTDRISELNVDQRITLAKDLRGRTRASYKQLAKVVRINYEDILSVFKGKR